MSLLGFDDFHLSIHSDMATVAKAMASPESGLEVRDRMWLKITIANAFIGMLCLSRGQDPTFAIVSFFCLLFYLLSSGNTFGMFVCRWRDWIIFLMAVK